MSGQHLDTDWLSLGDAARELGVHPTTLRRWADNGDIPVMTTPGGHRRFATADIAAFARDRHGLRRVSGIEQVWADQALTQTRSELVVRQNESWLANYDEEARLRHRLLGRQLMGLTLQYLSDENGGEMLEEARSIGQQYARIGLEMNLPLTEVLNAAMFFRDTLVETALQLPESTRIRTDANVRLLRRINRLLNNVHLGIAEVYDASFSDSVSGA